MIIVTENDVKLGRHRPGNGFFADSKKFDGISAVRFFTYKNTGSQYRSTLWSGTNGEDLSISKIIKRHITQGLYESIYLYNPKYNRNILVAFDKFQAIREK